MARLKRRAVGSSTSKGHASSALKPPSASRRRQLTCAKQPSASPSSCARACACLVCVRARVRTCMRAFAAARVREAAQRRPQLPRRYACLEVRVRLPPAAPLCSMCVQDVRECRMYVRAYATVSRPNGRWKPSPQRAQQRRIESYSKQTNRLAVLRCAPARTRTRTWPGRANVTSKASSQLPTRRSCSSVMFTATGCLHAHGGTRARAQARVQAFATRPHPPPPPRTPLPAPRRARCSILC